MSESLVLFFYIYYRSDATLDHLLDEATSAPVSHSEIVLGGLGVFSIVISFISLYKRLIIEMNLIPYVFLPIGSLIQHTLGNYDHYY